MNKCKKPCPPPPGCETKNYQPGDCAKVVVDGCEIDAVMMKDGHWLHLTECMPLTWGGVSCGGKIIDKSCDPIMLCEDFASMVDKGLTFNSEEMKLDAWIDVMRGLEFGGEEDRQIQVKVAEDTCLGFDSDGALYATPTLISEFTGAHPAIAELASQSGGDSDLTMAARPVQDAPVTAAGQTLTMDADGWIKVNYQYMGADTFGESVNADPNADIRAWGQRVRVNGDIVAIHDNVRTQTQVAAWPWGIRGNLESRWVKVSAGDVIVNQFFHSQSDFEANDVANTVVSVEYRACL